MSTPDENTNETSGDALQREAAEAASGTTAPETSPSHLAETTSAHMSDTSAGMAQAAPVVPPVVSPPPAATAPAAPAAPTGYAAAPSGYAAAPAAAPAYMAPNPTPNTWMNIVAFVTSLLGLAIVPIIFGHLGVSAANKGKAELKGLGIAGLIIGYITLVFWIVFIAIIIVAALASTTTSP